MKMKNGNFLLYNIISRNARSLQVIASDSYSSCSNIFVSSVVNGEGIVIGSFIGCSQLQGWPSQGGGVHDHRGGGKHFEEVRTIFHICVNIIFNRCVDSPGACSIIIPNVDGTTIINGISI